ASVVLLSLLAAPAATLLYPLSLHDALPISTAWVSGRGATRRFACWRHGDTRNGRRQTSINSLLPRSRSTAESRTRPVIRSWPSRSEEHTSELQSRFDLVCRLLLEKKKRNSD